MPSFDVTSSVDMHEVSNAVDQVRREMSTRYDFKKSKSTIELNENMIIILADDDMKLKAVQQLLREKLAKRKVSLKSIEFKGPEKVGGDMLKEEVLVKQSLTTEELRKLNKLVKSMKVKVTVQIQSDQLRVTGKKRDILQQVIEHLKKEVPEIDLHFGNYRD